MLNRFTNTNWNLYRSFVVVFETKNLHRAAGILGITRSAVGHNIKELSNQIGVKLFTPHRKGVEPTSEAIDLYKEIEPAIAKLCFGERNISEFNNESSGTLRIACTTNFASYYLADYISLFNTLYPNVHVQLMVRPVAEALKLLKNRDADIILSTLPLKDENLNAIMLKTLTSTFFASKEFANKYKINEIVSKKQFENLPYIATPLMAISNNSRAPVATAETLEATFLLVKKSLGIGACVEQFLEINHPNEPIVKFKVENTILVNFSLSCIYDKKLLSKTATAFISCFKPTL